MAIQTVSKGERLQAVLDRLRYSPPAHTSLEAYALFEKIINQVEDEFLGPHTYNPPRSLLVDFENIGRMYMTKTESMFSIPKYTGVHILVNHREVVFISRYGAIELQRKLGHDKEGLIIHFEHRLEQVLLQKPDAWGHGVWHPKNL